MHSGFSEVLNPTRSGPVFMGLAEDAILAVSHVAPQPSWLGGEAPEPILPLPYLWVPGMLLHQSTQINLVGLHTANHCDTYQLLSVTIPLHLFRFLPGLCCGSSHKAFKFAHLALTPKPCSYSINWARLLSIAVSLKFTVLVGNLTFCVFNNREEREQGEEIMACVWWKLGLRMLEIYSVIRSHCPSYVRM